MSNPTNFKPYSKLWYIETLIESGILLVSLILYPKSFAAGFICCLFIHLFRSVFRLKYLKGKS